MQRILKQHIYLPKQSLFYYLLFIYSFTRVTGVYWGLNAVLLGDV
jgi:hypothetical protein